MFNSLVQTGITNAVIVIPLAILALLIGSKNKNPHISHLLWLLVLVKLITPSFFHLIIPGTPSPILNPLPLDPSITSSTTLSLDSAANDLNQKLLSSKILLTGLWFTGTIVLLIFSLTKAFFFHRQLLASCQPAPAEVKNKARQLASALKLKKLPTIHTTSASLTPLVWWLGGRIHLVLPQNILQKMPPHEWQWCLAHELAHIKRRDHLVRWIEWASGLAFWWNPLMWLARKKLRAAEEICTDSLVLNTFQTNARSYAQSILNTLEALAPPAFRPPAMASEINSGGNLEKRMKHILNQNPSRKPRILQICVLLASTAFLPLGIAQAEEEKPKKKTNLEQANKERVKAAFQKIREAVAAGDLTKEEAAKKMEAIKKQAQRDHGPRAKYAEAEAKMKAAVEAGKMTRAQAEERLARLAKQLKAASEKKPATDKMRAIAEQIEEARKAGKITAEEAREKQEALRGRVAESGKANDQRMRRKKYAEAENKLMKAVEAGELSEEAAKNRLMQFKKRLWPDKEK